MIRSLSFLLLLLLPGIVNAQVTLAGKPFPEQCRLYDSLLAAYRDDTTVGTDVTRFFQPYITQAIKNDDKELELMLKTRLRWEAYDANEISEATYLSEYELLLLEIKKLKLNHLLALAYKSHSYYLRKVGKSAESTKYTLMAYEIYSKLSPDFFIYKKVFIMDLGGDYYKFKDYGKALKYLHEAAEVPTEFEPSLFNTIGMTYYQMGNDDSAQYYFDSAYNYSVKNNREDWQIIVTGNIVKILTRKQQYDSAIVLGKQVLKLAENYWERTVYCFTLLDIATAYKLKNDLKEAERYYLLAMECEQEGDPYWYYDRLKIKSAVKLYEEYAQVKGSMGQYKLAFMLLDTAKTINDSLSRKLNLDRLKNMEAEMAKNSLDNTNQVLVYEQAKTRQQRNLLLAGIILVTLVILLLINRNKLKRQKLEEEKKMADYMLQQSRDKLTDFTASIHEKNKLLEDLQEKLNKYNVSDGDVDIDYKGKLDGLKSSTILTDSEWADFKIAFDTVHRGYIDRLEKEHPELTQAEVRYFVLAKLGMNNKEMASVLGIAPSSARTLKSRIIKKLALSGEEALEELIETI